MLYHTIDFLLLFSTIDLLSFVVDAVSNQAGVNGSEGGVGNSVGEGLAGDDMGSHIGSMSDGESSISVGSMSKSTISVGSMSVWVSSISSMSTESISTESGESVGSSVQKGGLGFGVSITPLTGSGTGNGVVGGVYAGSRLAVVVSVSKTVVVAVSKTVGVSKMSAISSVSVSSISGVSVSGVSKTIPVSTISTKAVVCVGIGVSGDGGHESESNSLKVGIRLINYWGKTALK